MFRLKDQLIIEEETVHYFACLEIDLTDYRKAGQDVETYTLFFEVPDDSTDSAYKRAYQIIGELGFGNAGVRNLFVTKVPVESGKFWVLGKQKECQPGE